MKYAIPLSNETSGQILAKEAFNDIYVETMEEGRRYFWRINSKRLVELVVVFEDIEDFDRSLESGVTVDFQAYKDRFLLVVWTVSDPVNPLGFPISFEKYKDDDRAAIEQILDQPELTIHYLTLLDDDLLHIYSQNVKISEEEKALAQTIYQQEPKEEDEEIGNEFNEKDSDQLKDDQLNSLGVGYLLDYSSLIQKNGEEQAKEKLMSAILTAIDLVKRHPRGDVRNCSFVIWAAERREIKSDGREAALMEIYMTPPLLQLLEVINDDQQIENPLSTVLLAMPEFLTTVEAKPIDRGAYPLIQYEDHMISFIEPSEWLQKRLAYLTKTIPNPYLNEGDVVADGKA